MPKKLRTSLRLYLSKLKKIPSLSLPNTPTTNSLLSACKYPKTPSFSAADRHHPSDDNDAAATLSDVDRFLQENFHSLYLHDNDQHDTTITDNNNNNYPGVKASARFFVSPATSNSLADEARTSSSTFVASSYSSTSSSEVAVPGDSVAVMTLSKDPCDDFRRSMKDMIEARHAHGSRQPLDWDFMEELLFCFLELNERSVHKYILKAFTDLTVSFRRRDAPASRRRRRTLVVAPTAEEEKVKDCYYERRKHVEM